MFHPMLVDLPELEYQRFWRRLQQIGLNAYEARSYLVLIGHPKFKALELAARAHVPRQKIYEVLDSLVEKGFARVIQELRSRHIDGTREEIIAALKPLVDAGDITEKEQFRLLAQLGMKP